MTRGVFLDLNGTLVTPLKPERLEELTLIRGVIEAVARLTTAGFVCPVVTVQSRIAKGLFSLADFEAWFSSFAAELKRMAAMLWGRMSVPLAEPCQCKKPNTLLYERAASDHRLILVQSFVVGDSPDDVRAARRLGARGCLVRTGWASDPEVAAKAAAAATAIVDCLNDAVSWILDS